MQSFEYDYLIVGAGLYGSVFAHELTKAGKKCLVIDKRKHLGGNVFCENIENINVHTYGAHIFHTNDERIWRYVNQFAEFNNYINSPLANVKGKLYNLPFNMNTFQQLWNLTDPNAVYEKIQNEIRPYSLNEPRNLEENALQMVGREIYDTFIKHYTEKQWGKTAVELPSFIIKRIPLRYTFDNNYFNDKYQGIPIGGYNVIIQKLLKNIECRTGVDFFQDRIYFEKKSRKIVFTGKIDQFFDYKFSELEYRSLAFEHKLMNIENYQGNAVINFCDSDVPHTRIIEHKHFEFGKQHNTIITHEYPKEHVAGNEPYYPINNVPNTSRYQKYKELARDIPNTIFGGRLAEYKYFDMHQVIAAALKKAKIELHV